MATRAVRDRDDWVLTGAKRWIGLASIADVAIICAKTDEGVRGFVGDAVAAEDEGTDEIHTLIIGRAITGIPAFGC